MIYYTDDKVTLHHGDCLDVLATLPDASVDAVVTDPPYGLANTDPDHVIETLQRWIAGERDYLPGGRGFMGKEWDAFVPPVAVWDECLRVLKPGGHVLAFAGSRTVDLMTLGLRLAGFDIRDSIAWLYGSGFPKSMDVSKAIDKLDATDERTRRARAFQSWLRQYLTPQDVNRLTGTDMGHHLTTHPTQPAVATAELFDLLRSELPKVPQHIEDLVSERTVESQNFAARLVTGKHSAGTHRGVSGFTVAGEGKERRDFAHTPEAREWQGWGTALKPGHEPIVMARKPLTGTVAANVLEHGTGALNIDACRLHTQGSEGRDYTVKRLKPGATLNREGGNWRPENGAEYQGRTKDGRWPANVILDESQAEVLDEQSGTSKSRVGKPRGAASGDGWGMTATGAEYSDEGGASRFFYVAKAQKSERPVVDGVAHPTVKPLSLASWLVRLVTPPGGTVLEPFAGSGTTVEAAMREGFNVVAVEREADYLPLIMARIDREHARQAAEDANRIPSLFDEAAS